MNFKQNIIKIIRCTQLTSNWLIIVGSFKNISKWMRIHKPFAFWLGINTQLWQANKQTNQVRHKGKPKGKQKIFLYFFENVLEVGEMKTRGKWQMKCKEMKVYGMVLDRFWWCHPGNDSRILPATCELHWDSPEEERMMQYSRCKYLPQLWNQDIQ